ncbi:P-loop containing nucleoside triphosphate hydrolase protein [Russula brevipes]|nr:P-loop containing nucleoside triphosphate hydrolase protein [Russula brevipes]
MSTHPMAALLLQEARLSALEDRSYDSDATHNTMDQGLKQVFDGRSPYPWQLDVAEAIMLGLDCIVIAGTGAGKTIPFVLPFLGGHCLDKILIVTSPLNVLEFDQAERFKKMGLRATAVNGDSYKKELHLEIESCKYNIIITSPEMCLEHELFSALLCNPKFTKHVMAVVIDEAHCMSSWGDDFRKAFGNLGTLRSYVPSNVPFFATSAMLPPHILDGVIRKLHFSRPCTFLLNLGNDCPSVTHLVCPMKGAKRDLEALDFLVDEALLFIPRPLVQTIVFFKTCPLAYKGAKHLRRLLPPSLRSRVAFLTAGRSSLSKTIVMNEFRSGVIDILCATEAAGMGLDIQDISCVVGFMAPKSLSSWVQRSGCAGRSGSSAIAILLVEPSVFHMRKARGQKSTTGCRTQDTNTDQVVTAKLEETNETHDSLSDDEDQGQEGLTLVASKDILTYDKRAIHGLDTRYWKKVEGGLRSWIEPDDNCNCRREVSRKYFNNPMSQSGKLSGT